MEETTDLEKANKIVRSMLTVYGMSDRLPNLSLVEQEGGFLSVGPQQTARSPQIEEIIAQEQLEVISRSYDEAKALLAERRGQLEQLAERLLENEKLDSTDLAELLGPRPDSASS